MESVTARATRDALRRPQNYSSCRKKHPGQSRLIKSAQRRCQAIPAALIEALAGFGSLPAHPTQCHVVVRVRVQQGGLQSRSANVYPRDM